MKRWYPALGGSVAALALFGGVACSGGTEKVATGTTPGSADSITTSAPATTSSGGAQATSTTIPVQAGKELSAAELVRLAEPAVVRIETSGGVGSGFIVSEDGYLITNNHVVATSSGRAATTVQVRLSDGTDTTGRVVGADPRSDLAVVKIDGNRAFTALPLANLADVLVGAPGAHVAGPIAGRAYVVFGKADTSPVSLAELGTAGVVLESEGMGDNTGWSVQGAGDVDGDGFDDVIVGAPSADPNGPYSGRSYVVFGVPRRLHRRGDRSLRLRARPRLLRGVGRPLHRCGGGRLRRLRLTPRGVSPSRARSSASDRSRR
jgi:hypothetical protein